jgi:hypothetical protein
MRKTGGGGSGGGGDIAAAEVAAAATAQQQKAARPAGRQDSGGSRVEAAMAARRWRPQSKIGDRAFLYLTQKNHLKGFKLSHWCTLAGS